MVNYREPGAVEALRACSPGVDRIVEVAIGTNLEQDLALSGPGTTIVVSASEPEGDPVMPTGRLMAANVTLHSIFTSWCPACVAVNAPTPCDGWNQPSRLGS